MKTKLILIALILALAAALGLLGKLAITNRVLDSTNTALNRKLQEADLSIGRAHTELADANKKVSSLSDQLQSEVKELKASVTMYAELEAKYKVLRQQKGKTVIEYLPGEEVPCPEASFIRGMLYEAVTDKSLAAIESLSSTLRDQRLDVKCTVRPYRNNDRNIPFNIEYALHIRIKGQLVETRTKSGAINHFVELTEIDDSGKELGKMELSNFEVVVTDETEPHFFWWAPHVDVGILGGWHSANGFSAGGSIGFTPMAYGRTANDLTWRFVRISLDLSGSAGIGLSPVLYNIGDPLPLVSNIWIGPHLMWDFKKDGLLGVFIGGVL